jgi:hypothetical protein
MTYLSSAPNKYLMVHSLSSVSFIDEMTWEDGQNALFWIYTKDLKGVTKIRKERQEYPNKRFDEAIDEKLPTLIKMRGA